MHDYDDLKEEKVIGYKLAIKLHEQLSANKYDVDLALMGLGS
ncbi:MAG: hypothetical protein ABIB71_03795 [Candidatus Woesearchaeota archaeon]